MNHKSWLNGILFALLAAVALILFYACSTAPRTIYPSGKKYVTASWYGPKFNGRPTSSGERFNMYAMTCAHKDYPFGTRLRVTNPDNGKSVVVTVNDRGPFVRGRDLDLSYGAAREIGLIGKGVGRVKIEHIGRDQRYIRRVDFNTSLTSGPLTIQVGSFRDRANAVRLKKGLSLNHRDVSINTAFIDGSKHHRVRIGRFQTREKAYPLAKKLAREGYTTMIISR
jgi:rare lipoprotein A